jgi:hypothetical protein
MRSKTNRLVELELDEEGLVLLPGLVLPGLGALLLLGAVVLPLVNAFILRGCCN